MFAEMSALAVKTGAVNLGQGFPDEDGPREVAEAALAHAGGDAVEQAYARSDVFEKRQEMMEEWSRYLRAGVS